MRATLAAQKRGRVQGPSRSTPPAWSPVATRPNPDGSRQHVRTTAASSATVTSSSSTTRSVSSVEWETVNGVERLKYNPEGWNYWMHNGHKIHYVGPVGKEDGPAVVLVHGYGASAYHWRWNIPALAKAGYRVYAVCLLGFGYSEKALTDYTNGRVWVSQLGAFIREVVGGPAVLAGNSLGGYASLATAAANPDVVSAVALLNGAGPFDDLTKPPRPEEPQWWEPAVNAVVGAVKRVVLYFAFIRAKQPERIREVLGMVYASKESLDDDLVASIVNPALDPQASEVFFLVNHRTKPPVTVNKLLADMERAKTPLLLLWGDKDPWVVPSRAHAIKQLYPAAELVFVPAGHCPHDDDPQATNTELLRWLGALNLQQKMKQQGA